MTKNIHVFLLTILSIGLWLAMHWYHDLNAILIRQGSLLNWKKRRKHSRN